MKRTNQGGSVLSFIIIGGVMTLLLVGGVYMLRQHNQSSTVAVETPAAPTPQSTEGGAAPVKPSESDKTASDDQKSTEPTEAPATIPGASSAEGNASDESPAAEPTTSGSTSTSAPVGELPQTGPAQTISALLAISLLAGTSVAYMQSRRQSARL